MTIFSYEYCYQCHLVLGRYGGFWSEELPALKSLSSTERAENRPICFISWFLSVHLWFACSMKRTLQFMRYWIFLMLSYLMFLLKLKFGHVSEHRRWTRETECKCMFKFLPVLLLSLCFQQQCFLSFRSQILWKLVGTPSRRTWRTWG